MSNTYKTLLASALFVLLHANSASATVPVARASQNTTDVIIVTKPHFRYEDRHEIELRDENGTRFEDEMYTYLDFEIGSKTYSAWWRGRGSVPPVYLVEDVRYRFVIRLEHKTSKCQVVSIWQGKKLIWKNPKLKAKTQLTDKDGRLKA